MYNAENDSTGNGLSGDKQPTKGLRVLRIEEEEKGQVEGVLRQRRKNL